MARTSRVRRSDSRADYAAILTNTGVPLERALYMGEKSWDDFLALESELPEVPPILMKSPIFSTLREQPLRPRAFNSPIAMNSTTLIRSAAICMQPRRTAW